MISAIVNGIPCCAFEQIVPILSTFVVESVLRKSRRVTACMGYLSTWHAPCCRLPMKAFDNQRLQLFAFKRSIASFRYQFHIGYQRIRFTDRIILTEWNEIHVFSHD